MMVCVRQLSAGAGHLGVIRFLGILSIGVPPENQRGRDSFLG